MENNPFFNQFFNTKGEAICFYKSYNLIHFITKYIKKKDFLKSNAKIETRFN